jgi:hypothetical protein
VKNFVRYARGIAEQDDEKKDNAFAGVFARGV